MLITITIFDGKIDSEGNATIEADLNVGDAAPGMLKANFLIKVFEKGGDFSVDQFSIPYHPFDSYVGIKIPKGDKTRGMLLTDTNHVVNMVILDINGKPIKESHKIEMEFYKIGWKWWWDKSSNNLSIYRSSTYNKLIKKQTITAKNGKAKWQLRIEYPNWGRYLVRAHDLTTGHSSARIVYIDWPGWAGRSQKDAPGGAAMLSFTADKSKYNVGDDVTLTIPSSSVGRALISIENGSKVIKSFWAETQKGETTFTFKATEDMTPNVFANVTLLQPHAQTANDLPIRLYGVIPILVENPETHLHPVITMPDVLRSEEKVNIKVKEQDGKKMTYTIAIVDEGLLDLTRFKTPEPWNLFYAKEALGVRTWDIYDWVIGAYGGELERLLSIGGDDEGSGKEGGKKANRFKPMVRFLGPFMLNASGENTHTINIPRYIGSVRTMVIAGKDRAYGSAEKTTPVRKPLMVLGTLPRVLGPDETVKLPISVFAMEKNIKNVSVKIKTNDLLSISGDSKKTMKFSEPGDQLVEFDLKVLEKTGIATVQIIATSGKEKAIYDIELDVRNPNPSVTEFVASMIEPGKNWNAEYMPIGIKGTNKATIELSSIPPINLEKRLKFLIKYPHGCVEQTTSAIFPQLYLSDILTIDNKKKTMIDINIRDGIKRLTKFQNANGALGYWPNSSYASDWGTNYAGHFIIEAKKKGYDVPEGFFNKWKKYQKSQAQNWTDDGNNSQLIQAYRLYVLALAGVPELGAMNRLIEKTNLYKEAKWRLAAAYQLAGKANTANSLISNLSREVKSYIQHDYTFGSGVRDKAMILETLTLMNKNDEAFMVLRELSKDLGSERWYNTQTTAYSLIAVAGYIKNNNLSDKLTYTYKVNSRKTISKSTNKSISQAVIPVNSTNMQTVSIKNTNKASVFARIIYEGIPKAGSETSAENNLYMNVNYHLMDGTYIQPDKIEQGTDFYAEVIVSHPGARKNYMQMALTQIFPSGWEIINTRMIDSGNFMEASTPTYQDIRDDRVYTYYNINRHNKRTYIILLNASYVGRYYLPAVYSEAMYDNTINARKQGRWIEVVKP